MGVGAMGTGTTTGPRRFANLTFSQGIANTDDHDSVPPMRMDKPMLLRIDIAYSAG